MISFRQHAVSRQADSRWDVLSPLLSDLSLQWRIVQALEREFALAWDTDAGLLLPSLKRTRPLTSDNRAALLSADPRTRAAEAEPRIVNFTLN